MKRATLLATMLFFLVPQTPALARHHHQGHHFTHKFSRHLVSRHINYRHFAHHYARRYAQRYHHVGRIAGSLPGPCRVAASMGGPCGCWAAYTLLGRLDHVWRGVNLWLANDWLRFPRTAPAPGTAAVWPGRHVAPVVSYPHGDGTITVRDSWNPAHRVRMAGLVFVQPPGGGKKSERPELVRYAGAVPL